MKKDLSTYLREGESMSGGVEQRERVKISSRLLTECRASLTGGGCVSGSHDPETMIRIKIKSQALNQLCYLGTPSLYF